MVSEVDPICALQAAMEGYEVVTMEDAAPRADIFVTATGNKDIITSEHMRAMNGPHHRPATSSHFDNEIQIRYLKNLKWNTIKRQVDEIEFPDGKRMILLSEGRLVNLGNAMGHPSFVMSASFTNQTLAQIELFANNKGREIRKEGLRACRSRWTRRWRGCISPRSASSSQSCVRTRPSISASASRARSNRTITGIEVRALPWQFAKLSSQRIRNEVGSFLSNWSIEIVPTEGLAIDASVGCAREGHANICDVNTWS